MLGLDPQNRNKDIIINHTYIQRFRVRHGLSCVIGPVWPVGCYAQAAVPMPLSKPLYLKDVRTEGEGWGLS